MSFKIISVRRYRMHHIFQVWEVVAQDLETQYRVTALFGDDYAPDEKRVITGLEHKLEAMKRRDAFFNLPGRTIG